jgi:hypothetical protein
MTRGSRSELSSSSLACVGLGWFGDGRWRGLLYRVWYSTEKRGDGQLVGAQVKPEGKDACIVPSCCCTLAE